MVILENEMRVRAKRAGENRSILGRTLFFPFGEVFSLLLRLRLTGMLEDFNFEFIIASPLGDIIISQTGHNLRRKLLNLNKN